MATYTETFTGTNGTTPSGWTNRGGTIVIQGNEGAGTTSFGVNYATYTGQTFGQNQYTKATIKTLGVYTFGVAVRCSGTSYAGYWFHWNGSGTVTIREGLITVLQTITGVTLAVNDVIEIRAVGTTISVWKNGTQLGTDQTNATYQIGNAGIYIEHTVARLDDLETGDLDVVADTADLYFDFEDGADGDILSAANLTASVNPSPPWGTVARSGSFTSTRIEADGERAMPGSVRVAQVDYTDSGTRGLKRDHSQAVETINVTFPQGTRAAVSMGFWLYTTFPPSGSTAHTLAAILNTAESEFAALSFAPNASAYIRIGCETSSGNTYGTDTNIYTSTWYWITFQYSETDGLARLAVYDTSLTQVGATISAALSASPGGAARLKFGEHAAHSDPVTAYTLYDDVLVNWTSGTFPLLPTVAAGQPASRRMGGVTHGIGASPLSGRRW